jgi:hypothetical protein
MRPRALSHHWSIDGDDIEAPVWRLEFRLRFAPGTYEPFEGETELEALKKHFDALFHGSRPSSGWTGLHG